MEYDPCVHIIALWEYLKANNLKVYGIKIADGHTDAATRVYCGTCNLFYWASLSDLEIFRSG